MDNNTISLYEFLRTIFVIIDIFLLAFLVFLLVKGWKYRPNFDLGEEEEKTYTLGNVIIAERWESIISRSKINSPESIRLAIVDADNLVDDLLERMGLGGGDGFASKESKGASMADKLENLSADDFATLNRLWTAHRVRNKVVHEPGFVVSHEEAQRTLDDYASFLKEVGAIK